MEDRLRYLFKKYLDNTCTREEMEEFFGYVKQAEHDESLRQQIKNTYNELTDSGASIYVNEEGRLFFTRSTPEPISTPVYKQKRSKVLRITAMAASLILIIALLWIFNVAPGKEKHVTISSVTKKSTNRSETKFILLEDSTQVWLNSASSLEVPDQFDNNRREVSLTGEAYFDVKHADKIPFIIRTGDVAVTVLGTAFNIKAYPKQKDIIISVSRGKVKITKKDGQEITLTGGQQLKVKEDGNETSGKNIAAESVAGWQQGNLVYDDELLGDIVADLERVYNVTIQLSNQTLSNQRISTSFKREIGVEQALQVLCKLTDAQLIIGKDHYSILYVLN